VQRVSILKGAAAIALDPEQIEIFVRAQAHAYPLKRSDNRSIAEAVSAYLAFPSWRAHERPNASLRGPADRAGDRAIGRCRSRNVLLTLRGAFSRTNC
jgi:hypothetical protein